MSDFINQVVDFNVKVLKIEQRKTDFIDQPEFDISVKCLEEELQEFIDAYNSGNIIGCIDAMIDLRFFAVGVMYKFGLTPEMIKQCDTAVYEANIRKKLGVVTKRGDGSAADAIKPENWVSPEEVIATILDKNQ